MSRVRLSAVAVALYACGMAFAQPSKTTSMWNEEAAKSARAVVEQGLAAIERLDAEALRKFATADVVAYDIDLENKPVRMGSLNDAVAYTAQITAEVKKLGGKIKFVNTKYNCRATSDLAYCLLEYSFVATMADGTTTTQPSQTTVVLTKQDGAWKWVHWHTSLSAAPPAAGTK